MGQFLFGDILKKNGNGFKGSLFINTVKGCDGINQRAVFSPIDLFLFELFDLPPLEAFENLIKIVVARVAYIRHLDIVEIIFLESEHSVKSRVDIIKKFIHPDHRNGIQGVFEDRTEPFFTCP